MNVIFRLVINDGAGANLGFHWYRRAADAHRAEREWNVQGLRAQFERVEFGELTEQTIVDILNRYASAPQNG